MTSSKNFMICKILFREFCLKSRFISVAIFHSEHLEQQLKQIGKI